MGAAGRLVVAGPETESALIDFDLDSAGRVLHPNDLASQTAAVMANIGKVLAALSDAGLAEDTVVMYTSDHGEAFGEHGYTMHAGAIHSDFARGFIRAEVIQCETLLQIGSLATAREKGVTRVEGREYVVQDGDVIHFKVGA